MRTALQHLHIQVTKLSPTMWYYHLYVILPYGEVETTARAIFGLN